MTEPVRTPESGSGSARRAAAAAVTQAAATASPASDKTQGDSPKGAQDPSATLPVMPAAQPNRIGDYQILCELGRGGMGVVYKATDIKLKRQVALKMLWDSSGAAPDDLIRFRGEAELVAQLQHPNIVQIYDIGQHEGRPFLALEFVEGGSLDKLVKGQPQPPRHAAETVETLARAIHVAHLQGIIHRDLKPANVLLSKGGTLKITDFGLAKRLDHSLGCSRTGDVMGTPSYMAPEQALGQSKQLGPATDVYALGAILYELLTGRPPFRGVNVLETLEQVRLAEPASPSRLVPRLHRDLSTICLKCLQKWPGKRYASADALADDLRRWLEGHPILARPTNRWERLWRAVRRHPLRAALAVTSTVLVVALVFLGLLARERAHQDTIQAQDAAYRKLLQQQHDHSLNALNDILNLVVGNGPLSKQPGLEPLQQKLLQYYEELVRQQEQDQLANRENLADACERLGRLISKTGNKAEALKAFGKAQELYSTSADGSPAPPHLRHRLALVHLERGILCRDLGRLAEADVEYSAALALLDSLCREDPETLDYHQHLAEVWHNRGIHLAAGNKPAALEAYRKALAVRQELCRKQPENLGYLRDLARSHGYIGDVELDLGRFADADASYWESHRRRLLLAEKDKRDPAEAQFQLARSFSNFGNYQARTRAVNTAIDFFERSLAIQEKLAGGNLALTEYQSDLGTTCNRIADLKLLKGEPVADVRPFLDKAVAKYKPLHETDRQAVGLRRGLAESYALLAQLLIDSDPAAAAGYLESARALLSKLCDVPSPDAGDLYYLATLQALSGELAEKMEAYKSRSTEADRALKTLARALQADYRRKHLEDLKQVRAFKSLRQRPEFQTLVRRDSTS